MTRATLDGSDEAIGRLREAAGRLCGYDRYRGASGTADLALGDVGSPGRFRELPAADASDGTGDVRSSPPFESPAGPDAAAGEDAVVER